MCFFSATRLLAGGRSRRRSGIGGSALSMPQARHVGVVEHVENLLWRIQNGELEGISPRAVVLLIGTNNLPVHRPGDIADGISAAVRTIQLKMPATKILLLGLLPRGPQNPRNASPANPYYQDGVTEVNRRISVLDNGDSVRFLDVGSGFLSDDGQINRELLPDLLHPVAAGFHVLGSLIRPALDEMIADPVGS